MTAAVWNELSFIDSLSARLRQRNPVKTTAHAHVTRNNFTLPLIEIYSNLDSEDSGNVAASGNALDHSAVRAGPHLNDIQCISIGCFK